MLKLLDCTLRDGAHINSGKFDETDFSKVLKALSNDIVDYVEVGLLEPNHPDDAISFFRSISAAERVVREYGSKGQNYGLLLRTDRCPIELIEGSDALNFVRIAMYPEHAGQVRRYVKKLQTNGYKVAINPIGISTLSESEIFAILDMSNEENIDTFSIVDTHGALTVSTLAQLLCVLDERLRPGVSIGLHFHENMNQCQSLVHAAINAGISDRELIIDASLNGMGRVPGNLALELLLQQLTDLQMRNTSPSSLYEVIGDLREKYFDTNPWGYSLIYGEAGRLNVNRSYAEFFHKSGLPMMQIMKCLLLLKDTTSAGRFNESVANELLSKNFDT